MVLARGLDEQVCGGETLARVGAYCTLNRLMQAIQPDPVDPLQQLTESFQYDPVGNRTASNLATGQVHDAANRLLEDSNFTYAYDDNGNLTEKTDKATGDLTVYTYNVENQLVRVEKFTVAGGVTPELVAKYRYDALGRRIAKEVTQAGTTIITRYVYDNEDILLELDGTNTVTARYTHGPGIDEPLIMARDGQSFFFHIDGLGTVWDLTDATGAIARSYTYDSFGQLISQTGTLVNPYTYTAREFDPETDLYYYRSRYYDPRTGRFLHEDPLGLIGGVNLYIYISQNPLIAGDPFGLLNPTKAAVGLANVGRAGGKFAKAFLKIGIATGLVVVDGPVPIGDVAAVPVFISGTVNLAQGYFLQRRGFQQFFEALNEPHSSASQRNFLGLLPFGQRFDDPCEPTPLEFLETQSNKAVDSMTDFLEALGEISTLF
ncbi:MAG: RHS repeat domain-containing protein [Candidatus Binatia bacterium]